MHSSFQARSCITHSILLHFMGAARCNLDSFSAIVAVLLDCLEFPTSLPPSHAHATVPAPGSHVVQQRKSPINFSSDFPRSRCATLNPCSRVSDGGLSSITERWGHVSNKGLITLVIAGLALRERCSLSWEKIYNPQAPLKPHKTFPFPQTQSKVLFWLGIFS